MACAISAPHSLVNPSSLSQFLFPIKFCTSIHFSSCKPITLAFRPLSSVRRNSDFICRAEKEYKFPDPIPEFADSETEKFKNHLVKKLSKKDMFGDSIDDVVGICTEIFSNFLHTEYGGPGTLLVLPFIDMADTINERGLPEALRLHEQLLNGLRLTWTRTGKSGLAIQSDITGCAWTYDKKLKIFARLL